MKEALRILQEESHLAKRKKQQAIKLMVDNLTKQQSKLLNIWNNARFQHSAA